MHKLMRLQKRIKSINHFIVLYNNSRFIKCVIVYHINCSIVAVRQTDSYLLIRSDANPLVTPTAWSICHSQPTAL